jgi:hypothetical protein
MEIKVEIDKDDIVCNAFIELFAICGIVLRKIDDGLGQFCRVGMFSFWEDREEEKDMYKPSWKPSSCTGEKLRGQFAQKLLRTRCIQLKSTLSPLFSQKQSATGQFVIRRFPSH